MKLPLASALLAASVLFAALAPLIAATKQKINASPIVAGPPLQTYGQGTPREKVIEVLGAPAARVGSNIWIYFDFRADQASVDPSLDALVIAFKDERVLGLKLADGRVVRAAIARSAGNPTGLLATGAPGRPARTGSR